MLYYTCTIQRGGYMVKFDTDTPWYRKMKLLRVEKDLIQSELAEKLGVSTRSIVRWESGFTIPLPIIRDKISSILGAVTTDLFGTDPKVKEPEEAQLEN